MSDMQQSRAVRKQPIKLSTSITLMVSVVLASLLLVVHLLYFFQISDIVRQGQEDKAFAVARTLAASPALQQAMLNTDSDLIQPLASAVQTRNDLLFVVVTNMDGIRYSHPNPDVIGHHFIGDDINIALLGKENASVNRGVLAEALRVFTPVYGPQHRQIGVVAIGIPLTSVASLVNENRWNILWTVLFGTLVGSLGIWCLVKMLKRIMFGYEPYEISRLFEQRQAMLQSIKEGVIAVDDQAHVTLINQAARQMFRESGSLENMVIGNAGQSLPMLTNLREVLRTGVARRDEEINFKGRMLLSNTVPVRSNEVIIGAICTFRDKTEIHQLMQRLSGMVNYADALRVRSHEFMNKLHVILGLLHMKSYMQLEDYILKSANNYQTEIGSLLLKIKSPVIAGFLLGKINRAGDSGHVLTLSDESQVPDNENEQQTTALITVLGNLIENALDAMHQQPEGEVNVLLHYQQNWLTCEVSDDGPGIQPEHIEAIFAKGFSSKGEDRGVGLFLAKQQVESLGGTIMVESEPGVYTQFLVQLPWDGERMRR
ncbi:sensor histidine kinase [Erwiniaceae bacterium BAC15a-03b]|uniref:Sensor histidine kinase DcuS n=1 Tax=Winslowiella arboricola TaxID=2978220 RepID=A0A9J6PMP8_9GAMM|nr:sensor histidine kinase [Winslowiella arboricola]MCU5774070.1 sensor histidine kinase [Winslowiella arboricola]MCU5776997.1 sensor histidine kinase [Winslowiella arboricola]